MRAPPWGVVCCVRRRHLSGEFYTSEPPRDVGALHDCHIRDVVGCVGESFNCSNNCHQGLWLVDAGTGFIERRGFAYAAACGPEYVACACPPAVASFVPTRTRTPLSQPPAASHTTHTTPHTTHHPTHHTPCDTTRDTLGASVHRPPATGHRPPATHTVALPAPPAPSTRAVLRWAPRKRALTPTRAPCARSCRHHWAGRAGTSCSASAATSSGPHLRTSTCTAPRHAPRVRPPVSNGPKNLRRCRGGSRQTKPPHSMPSREQTISERESARESERESEREPSTRVPRPNSTDYGHRRRQIFHCFFSSTKINNCLDLGPLQLLNRTGQ